LLIYESSPEIARNAEEQTRAAQEAHHQKKQTQPFTNTLIPLLLKSLKFQVIVYSLPLQRGKHIKVIVARFSSPSGERRGGLSRSISIVFAGTRGVEGRWGLGARHPTFKSHVSLRPQQPATSPLTAWVIKQSYRDLPRISTRYAQADGWTNKKCVSLPLNLNLSVLGRYTSDMTFFRVYAVQS